MPSVDFSNYQRIFKIFAKNTNILLIYKYFADIKIYFPSGGGQKPTDY